MQKWREGNTPGPPPDPPHLLNQKPCKLAFNFKSGTPPPFVPGPPHWVDLRYTTILVNGCSLYFLWYISTFHLRAAYFFFLIIFCWLTSLQLLQIKVYAYLHNIRSEKLSPSSDNKHIFWSQLLIDAKVTHSMAYLTNFKVEWQYLTCLRNECWSTWIIISINFFFVISFYFFMPVLYIYEVFPFKYIFTWYKRYFTLSSGLLYLC